SAKTSGEAPHIHHTYFPEHLSKLFYFKDPKMLLGLDRTTGKLYRSHDHGKKWDHVTEIPSGKASRLYGHPFEDKIAFVLSAGTEHWLTRDEGKTWEAFGTPLPPTSSGEHVLGFHATRTGWILFTGERCKEDASGWWPFPKMVCQDEAFYTKDGFKEAAKDHKSGDKSGAGITSLLGANKPVGKCIWAHQNKAFETMAEEAIFCLEVVDAKEAQKSTSKRSLPMHAFGTSPQMSPDRLHIRDFIYPNSRRRRSNPRVSGFPDENVSDQSGLAKRNVIEDAISAMELRSRYIVRLVSSENFFDTKKI
ncbi:vacuolar protein sorting/targeting protein PEP1, partial [Linderina macrospora]